MKYDSGDVLALLLRLPADIILVTLAGILSITTAFHYIRSTNASTYTYFIKESSGYDVIFLSLVCIGLLGAVHVAIAFVRIRGFCRLNFNKYVISLVAILMANFIIGILLTELRRSIPESLEAILKPKLQESILSQRSLGVGYEQAEKWDLLQVEMKCCGVENYQDYLLDKKSVKEQTIPMSCCVMKNSRTTDGQLIAENPSQCILDATHRVGHSIFIHIQGCRSPLARWTVSHISRVTAMMFASICLQAVTLLYLSWQGYQRQSALLWR